MAGKFVLPVLTQHAKVRQYWKFNQNPQNPAPLTHCYCLHRGILSDYTSQSACNFWHEFYSDEVTGSLVIGNFRIYFHV